MESAVGAAADVSEIVTKSSAAGRRPIYFNEFNVRMGRMSYLPLVSGLLRAHAETSERIRAHYRFKPFIYYIDSFDNVMARYDEAPAIAAFSLAMWNEQLNLRVAAEVKRRWPDCRVVVGGAQVPHKAAEYLAQHRFIDIAVRGEGEETFTEILEKLLDGDDLSGIPGVTWRDPLSGEIRAAEGERPFNRDLNQYPSPYLEGLFDDLIAAQNDGLEFQAIIETNRGCPFHCTFCYWGRGGLSRKYRYHEIDRVYAEIEWCARSKIRYVFNADSNFGMYKRDSEIAQHIVAMKQRYGFPEKFRTCYGKNTDEKIFQIGSLFHRHQLEKGITLSRQSNDEQVLKNIKRANIKMSTYQNLQMRFNDEDIPIYSELILGLPGETTETWQRGVAELLEAGLKNQLFIYLCQVFPNTDLGDPEYQAKFAIKTQRVELNEIHGSVRDRAWVTEYEDIVVQTETMTTDEWKRMVVFSWLTMTLHSLKLGFFVMLYLFDRLSVRHTDFIAYLAERRMPAGRGAMMREEIGHFEAKIAAMLAGGGRGYELKGYGDIYWDVEEASFLRIAERLDQFYDELHDLLRSFLDARGVDYDATELAEVVRYQRLRIPIPEGDRPTEQLFTTNLPEYFATRFSSAPVPLMPIGQTMTTDPVDFGGVRERFARETILWGRKSGTMLVRCDYDPPTAPMVLPSANSPAHVAAAD
jgi:putative methyltransferase